MPLSVCEYAKCGLGISSGLMVNCGFLYSESQFYMTFLYGRPKRKRERERDLNSKKTNACIILDLYNL